jgi:hypothetical protein
VKNREFRKYLVEIRAGDLPAIEFDTLHVGERSEAGSFERLVSLELKRDYHVFALAAALL